MNFQPSDLLSAIPSAGSPQFQRILRVASPENIGIASADFSKLGLDCPGSLVIRYFLVLVGFRAHLAVKLLNNLIFGTSLLGILISWPF